MKAAVYYGAKDIRIEDVDYPSCPKDGVVIKVHSVGICGSDLRTYQSGTHKIKPPMILGHEVAGEIVNTGDDFNYFQKGDRITFAPGIYCGQCYYCQRGMTSMCENLVELGFQFPGGFAEYMAIPGEAFERGRIVEIPDNLSYNHAALCEPPSSCIYAQERADVTLGDTIVIIGAGPIGCIHIQVARARGAFKIIMIEMAPERLELAKSFKADFYINPSEEDPIAKVMEITSGLGADKIIIAAPSSIAQEQSIEMIRKRGTIVFYGGLPQDKPYSRLNSNLIHYRDINIIGHYGQDKRHVSTALDMILDNSIDADKLISDTLPLSDIHKGFDMLLSKKVLKIILNP